MNNKSKEILEFYKITEELKKFALSDIAKERIEKLEPKVQEGVIKLALKETTEARRIVDISSSIPINSLKNMGKIVSKIEKGTVLVPEELEAVANLLRDTAKVKRFMKDKEYAAPTISSYAYSICELDKIKEEIERCIVHGTVDNKASSKLQKIRKKIYILEDRIKSKLDSILRSDKYKPYIQDTLVSQRDGRYIIPVKSQYKKCIDGEIHDKSQSGSTVFIEPAEVKRLQDELNENKLEEEKEVYRILSELTAAVYDNKKEVKINIEIMANYDFIFAKGKYSKAISGTNVRLNTRNYINLKQGKHPLLDDNAVPLDFTIGRSYRGLVITGPNTGGKTVTLKAIGLLTMMIQAGLHIPAAEESEMAIFQDVFVDIGDGQSIEQSLSTFSSHINNVISILDCAGRNDLVIVDEIGQGTDPGEGMGIAIAVLEELYNKGATICATTHYSEIKRFAEKHEGFINGSMGFDINTLKPLYKLSIGKAGESNAFLIALRLGMSKKIIERAHFVTYKEEKSYEDVKYEKPTKNEEEKEMHKKQVREFKEGIKIEEEKQLDKKELYPEDYDFDIIFKSKEYRKKNKLMSKHHVEGMTISDSTSEH
ncbi:endonuclease MutS2 [Clostridium guangxiense]|uniref:endonuclease MutS2 n=1 Tax=Clostridium guangxiense TaxID=1662055 RepID=UPI001E3304C5|nr:endonuclease MutS2 [Clostridium guangxiense]MCD2348312.1 endonuclease MutS2 [Clostridium guangxiense]